jgi:putative dimethyl sulfoxide reductase chaperone
VELANHFLERENHRENCYRLLSACYCLPGPDLLELEPLDHLIRSLELMCREGVAPAKKMKAALAQYTEAALLVDYSKLFLGPFKVLAPPYGSVYLDPTRMLMGDSTADVIKWYQETGLAFDRAHKDLPDHIAVELEFMSSLIWKGRAACQSSNHQAVLSGIEHQQAFLEQHLGAWVPKFATAIKDGTDNVFYKCLADSTTIFIKSDLRYLDRARLQTTSNRPRKNKPSREMRTE